MKHQLLLLIMALLPLCASADVKKPAAQQQRQLVVYAFSGKPELVGKTSKRELMLREKLTMDAVLNIPFDASVELFDEQARQNYHIKAPGKAAVAELIKDKRNSVLKLTQRYFDYVQARVQSTGKVRQMRVSDVATVTRTIATVDGSDAYVPDVMDSIQQRELQLAKEREAREKAARQKQKKQNDMRKKFDSFTKQSKGKYDTFRKQCIKEYADFVRRAWDTFGAEPPIKLPEIEEMPLIIAPDDDSDEDPIVLDQSMLSELAEASGQPTDAFRLINMDKVREIRSMVKGKMKNWYDKRQARKAEKEREKAEKAKAKQEKEEAKRKEEEARQQQKELARQQKAEEKRRSRELEVDAVIVPELTHVKQPQPIEPVEEVPDLKPTYYEFTFYGTPCKVRLGSDCRFTVRSLKENDIADAIEHLADKRYDNLLYDCLQLRDDMQLGDWAYYKMLKQLSDEFCGKQTNEATLLLAFLYAQSGYKMRLAHNGRRLTMLAASRHTIFHHNYFVIDNEKFYVLEDDDFNGSVNICRASFPKESSLSLQMNGNQQYTHKETPTRSLTSQRYPEFSFSLNGNRNVLDFQNSYPRSQIGNNVMTQWSMYADTPIDQNITKQIYPAMKQKLEGLSQLEAVERLLNWVQTAFVYQYDDQVWGGDRAFFGEETLYYPFCDCEDRSILLSHLVRDLVGLDVVLVYYPGHLAMAVNFPTDVAGDYIMVNGRKFVVSDPTYIGARVGRTMPQMDNNSAQVILLTR